MKTRALVAGVAAAATMTVPMAVTAPADAARCVSGPEIRQQVSTFVHSLRDDVPSTDARVAVRRAFVESVRAARGAKADTPAERRGLGEQISALAKQKKDAESAVERKALTAAIHALQEQKRQDRVSEDDVEQLRTDVRAVRRAIIGRVDTRAERNQVATFVHGLLGQFDC